MKPRTSALAIQVSRQKASLCFSSQLGVGEGCGRRRGGACPSCKPHTQGTAHMDSTPAQDTALFKLCPAPTGHWHSKISQGTGHMQQHVSTYVIALRTQPYTRVATVVGDPTAVSLSRPPRAGHSSSRTSQGTTCGGQTLSGRGQCGLPHQKPCFQRMFHHRCEFVCALCCVCVVFCVCVCARAYEAPLI